MQIYVGFSTRKEKIETFDMVIPSIVIPVRCTKK